MINEEVIFVGANGNIKVIKDKSYQFDFLCNLILPIIDSYWVVFIYAYSLVPNYFCEEKWLYDSISNFACWLYDDRIISYLESCSLETIKNAVNMYLNMKIFAKRHLETIISGTKDEIVITLSEKYQDEDTLNEALAHISHFKKNNIIVGSIKREILP